MTNRLTRCHVGVTCVVSHEREKSRGIVKVVFLRERSEFIEWGGHDLEVFYCIINCIRQFSHVLFLWREGVFQCMTIPPSRDNLYPKRIYNFFFLPNSANPHIP